MPEAATAEEIETVYLEGWKLGLKAIAVYRDNSKRSQPLSTSKKADGDTASSEATNEVIEALRKQLARAQAEAALPHRRRLPSERTAITHKFDIAGHEGYITVGLYPDGQPGEIFLKMAKEGSTVQGLMDAFATTVSVSLQYGVPLRDLVNKFAHVRFEPSGFTGNQEIPIAKSLVDYIFRWLGSRFLSPEEKVSLGLQPAAETGDEPPASGFGAGAAAFLASAPTPAVASAPEPAPAAGTRQGDRAREARRHRRRSGPGARPRGTGGHRDQRPRPRGCGERWLRQAGQRQRRRRHLHDHPEPGRHEGVVPDPGGRPRLLRLRLDHGPQRLLLQVPQLREHQRLLLSGQRPSVNKKSPDLRALLILDPWANNVTRPVAYPRSAPGAGEPTSPQRRYLGRGRIAVATAPGGSRWMDPH